MKKAKVMLTAIALTAVVGGVFAFKARTQLFVYQLNAAKTTCPILSREFNLNPAGASLQFVFTSPVNIGATVATQLCTATITAVED